MNTALCWNGPAEAATDPSGPTGRLCAWLQGLRLEDVPAAVRERAKDVVLDGIGCALVGAQLPWSRVAVETLLRFDGQGARTIVGWDRTAPALSAALLNSTFIQGFELDDFHPRAPLHSASLVLPALLACAEERGGVTGAEFLLGAVAGFEVGPRVGLALHGSEMLSRGWHSGSVFGTHAAAAAAGTLLHLDAARFEDALGLAGTQSCGLMAAQFEAMCKRMHHGFASRNGLFSALMAAGGYTGIKRVFEREYGGFLSMFGEGHHPLPSEIDAELGVRWETSSIVVKSYPAMGGVHAPLDGILQLLAERPIDAAEVAQIDIQASAAIYHHGFWELERPITTVAAQMNIGYAVAVAILDGRATVGQFSPERIDRDDVWALIPKIRVHHNEGYDKGGRATRLNMHMAVTLTDGSVREVFLPTTRIVSDPLDREQIIAKFKVITEGIIGGNRQDAIIETTLGVDKAPDLAPVMALLAPAVEPAFA